MTMHIIRAKREALKHSHNDNTDFLERLLSAGDKFDDIQLRDNVFMMFAAGHDVRDCCLHCP